MTDTTAMPTLLPEELAALKDAVEALLEREAHHSSEAAYWAARVTSPTDPRSADVDCEQRLAARAMASAQALRGLVERTGGQR